jgi:peptidoglycan/LPS O-acetylase OafA/YrhL
MLNTRINEIDLLRFIAALSVIFFHYTFRGYAADSMSIIPYPFFSPYSKYGYLGVELFFMISGFVILMTASSGSFQKFFISRVVRLYPVFWASCTITFILTLLIGEPRYTATLNQYLINMMMINKFVGIPSIDDAYWSLFVEIQFYFLIGIVLVFKKISNIQIFLIIWILLSIVLEFFPVKLLNFFLIINYSSYFIAGSIYYLILSEGVTLTRVFILFLSWGLALFQAIGQLQGFEHKYNIDMNSFVVGGVITSFFVVMLLIALKRTGRIGQIEWILLGAITYPIYLLHENIGFMIFNRAYPYINKYVLLFLTFTLILTLSYLVHIIIEKRFSPIFKSGLYNVINSLYTFKIK